jgi:hypothetical protein
MPFLFGLLFWVSVVLCGYRVFRRRRGSAIGWGIGAFFFMLCWGVSGGAGSSTDDSQKVATAATAAPTEPHHTPRKHARLPTPEPTPDVTPKPDYHQQRVAYQQYWNKATSGLAMAYVCINYAAKSVEQGDMVSASKLLSRAEDFANQEKQNTEDNVPERFDNDDIKLNLFMAANQLADAAYHARSFLDDQKPSDMASAQDLSAQAAEYVTTATHAARLVYIDMGGKGDDLESMQDQATSVVKVMDSLVQ